MYFEAIEYLNLVLEVSGIWKKIHCINGLQPFINCVKLRIKMRLK